MTNDCSIPGIAAITGPGLIGYVMLNWGLFGVLTVQVYLYYLSFPNEKWEIKYLVYTVYALEVAQTIMLTDNSFRIFASGFGDFMAIVDMGTIWIPIGILGAISACAVQCYYAYRIKVISGKKPVAIAIAILALFSMCAGFACAALMHQAAFFTKSRTLGVLITTGVWEGTSAVCDVLIATSVTYYLRQRAKSVHIAHTHALVERIIRLTVETGTLTALVSIVAISVTYLPGRMGYYQAPAAALAKLYANTLLVHLNSRMMVINDPRKTQLHMMSSRGAVSSGKSNLPLQDDLNGSTLDRHGQIRAEGKVNDTTEAQHPMEDEGRDNQSTQGLSRAETPAVCV